jgi:hypothetical protein
MKRVLPLLLGVAFMVLTMAACEGDEGPVGPAGPQGPPGEPGDPGQNALNTCVDCHNNDTELLAIELQYAQSGHFDTIYWERTGACMECHNHNGFITAVVNGEDLPSSFDNPVPINCRTCHQIHTEFTGDDYDLTTIAAVDLKVGDFFDVGTGNLCANCHQSRPISPMPEIGGAQITLTAQGGVNPPGNRYGPHYAPQANVMVASGMFEFEGSLSYPATNPHAADCSACHMLTPAVAQGAGYVAGGHQFGLSWNDGANQLVAACTQCHAGASSFDHFGGRTQIQGLLATLRGLLEDEGIMRPADYYANPGTYDPEVAMAFLNWKFIYHDSSYGSHNPGYARAILQNSIEAMEDRLPPP